MPYSNLQSKDIKYNEQATVYQYPNQKVTSFSFCLHFTFCCMQNIKSVINNHNMKVLNDTAEIEEGCNCRNRNNCPLDGKCLTQTSFTKHRSRQTSPPISKKFTQEPLKQILNTGLTTTLNHSTLNTMRTTQNYLKNNGQ